MKSHDHSIVELLDEAGKQLCTIVKGDGEVGKMFLVLLIPRGTFCKSIVDFIHPLLKYCNVSLETFDLLLMDIISNSDGVGKTVDNRLELVQGWVRGGSEDILHRGGREGEPPGVGGGESNVCNCFGDIADLKGIVVAKAKMSGEMVSGLLMRCTLEWAGVQRMQAWKGLSC